VYQNLNLEYPESFCKVNRGDLTQSEIRRGCLFGRKKDHVGRRNYSKLLNEAKYV